MEPAFVKQSQRHAIDERVRLKMLELQAACESGEMTGVTMGPDGYVISREGLIAYAKSKGERPSFLFEDDLKPPPTKRWWQFWR